MKKKGLFDQRHTDLRVGFQAVKYPGCASPRGPYPHKINFQVLVHVYLTAPVGRRFALIPVAQKAIYS